MLAQNLLQSVIFAQPQYVDRLAAELLAIQLPGGAPLVQRVDTPTGFQLLASMEVQQPGNWQPSVIFEFANPAQGAIISYDPRLVQVNY